MRERLIKAVLWFFFLLLFLLQGFSGAEDELRQSIKEMKRYGIDIIPTPKNILFSGKKTVLIDKEKVKGIIVLTGDSEKYRIAADEINRAVTEAGSRIILPVKNVDELTEEDVRSFNMIVIGSPGKETKFLKEFKEEIDKMVINLPDTQGYIVKPVSSNNLRNKIIFLTGKGDDGTLYAVITLCYLIKNEDSVFYIQEAEIKDWPDYKFRFTDSIDYEWRRINWYKPEEIPEECKEKLKEKIDWCLRHKINMVKTPYSQSPSAHKLYSLGDQSGCEGDPRIYSQEEKRLLKEISEYAWKRGIRMVHVGTWNVGISQWDKDKPEYEGTIDHRGGLYCWSRDDLLQAQAKRWKEFIEETGVRVLLLHALDTTNERWEERCNKCRFRFGNDRIAGDAHVINTFYNTINPDSVRITFGVWTHPYRGDIDLFKGPYKGYFERLTGMIPKDVYLIREGFNGREGSESWKKVIRQPIIFYYYVSGYEFRLAKTCYFGDPRDVFWYCRGRPRSIIQILGAAEYGWNVNAPGAEIRRRDPNNPALIVPSELEPRPRHLPLSRELDRVVFEEFIPRAATHVFGKETGRYIAKVFTPEFFYDWQGTAGDFTFFIFSFDEWFYNEKYIGNERTIDECIGMMEDHYKGARDAIPGVNIILEQQVPLKKGTEPLFIQYCEDVYLQKIGSEVMLHYLKAKRFLDSGEIGRAKDEVSKGYESLETGKSEMRRLYEKIEGKTAIGECQEYKVSLNRVLKNKVEILEKKMDIIKLKVSLKSGISEKQDSMLVKNVPSLTKGEKIKVAVYNSGVLYGQQAVYNLLKEVSDFNVEFITNLSFDRLANYHCLVFPDCNNFGSGDEGCLTDIRKYVIETGGGVIFLHDSVGFERFPLGMSMFPEIAEAKERVGPFGWKNVKPEDKTVMVTLQHPVTEGYIPGKDYFHWYYDHITLIPHNGMVLVEDYYGNPVVVCGEIGKGKVVFNGTYFDNLQKDEKGELYKPVAGVDRDFLVNAIYWISNAHKIKDPLNIKLTGKKKEQFVGPLGTDTLIKFTLNLKVFQPLSEVAIRARVIDSIKGDIIKEEEITRIGKIESIFEDTFFLYVGKEIKSLKLALIVSAKELPEPVILYSIFR